MIQRSDLKEKDRRLRRDVMDIYRVKKGEVEGKKKGRGEDVGSKKRKKAKKDKETQTCRFRDPKTHRGKG